MLIDLQVHSTYSDGYLTPTELAGFLAKNNIKVASLTDHNTLGGQPEFARACQRHKIKTVPGLELYVTLNHRKFNILWFNYRDSSRLHKILRESQIRRRDKVRKALNRLKRRGLKTNTEETIDKYTHYIPLNQVVWEVFGMPGNKKVITRVLGNKNPREEEIIREYFRNHQFGILNESYINIKRILELRKKVGGQIILNHPGKHNQLGREFLQKLKKLGIDGIEILSPHHSVGAAMYAQQMARELNFIETGGSDFHRHEGGGFPLQNSLEYFRIDSKYLKGVEKIIG